MDQVRRTATAPVSAARHLCICAFAVLFVGHFGCSSQPPASRPQTPSRSAHLPLGTSVVDSVGIQRTEANEPIPSIIIALIQSIVNWQFEYHAPQGRPILSERVVNYRIVFLKGGEPAQTLHSGTWDLRSGSPLLTICMCPLTATSIENAAEWRILVCEQVRGVDRGIATSSGIVKNPLFPGSGLAMRWHQQLRPDGGWDLASLARGYSQPIGAIVVFFSERK